MNGDIRTIGKLLIRLMGIYFLVWGLIEAADIVTNYIMVWTHVFLRDELAVRPRMITMAFEFVTFVALYYKGDIAVDFLLDGLEGRTIDEKLPSE